MLKGEDFMRGKRYIEGCLWDYYANISQLESMKLELEDLQSVRGHSYEAHVQYGTSEPVFNVVSRKLNLEKRIAKIERRIQPVKRLKTDFEAGAYRERYMRDIFNIRYMEHGSVDYITRTLHISQPTYWRNNQKLLDLAGKYFADEE